MINSLVVPGYIYLGGTHHRRDNQETIPKDEKEPNGKENINKNNPMMPKDAKSHTGSYFKVDHL